MNKPARITGHAARRAALLAGTIGLSIAAAALAHARGPDFPISVAQARDRAEARFQQIDADRSGEISLEELAAAPDHRMFALGGPHRHRHHHAGDDHGTGDHGADDHGAERGKRLMLRGDGDPGDTNAAIFAHLDDNGDGLLSQDEFDAGQMREARHALMRERVFARLDADGSGGLSRAELPDLSRHLAAMDTDGDGTVTRDEARQHRQARRQAHRDANR